MSEETFEAATVEAALEKAASALGVAVTDLEHEVIAEARDFWGGDDGTVKIKARPRATEQEVAEEPEPEVEPEPAAEPEVAAEPAATEEPEVAAEPVAAEAPVAGEADGSAGGGQEGGAFWTDEEPKADDAPAQPEQAAGDEAPLAESDAATDDVAVESEPAAVEAADIAPGEGVEPEAITKLLHQIFHDMEFDCTVEITVEPDGFLATVSGEDKEALLEGNGRALSALELLANNAFRHKLPRGNKVRVDAGDFRSRRDDELADLALQVAHSAKESGRTQETQPLNPYERRLVHLALADDAAVTTRSRGNGFLKNVQVIPESKGREGGNRGGRSRR